MFLISFPALLFDYSLLIIKPRKIQNLKYLEPNLGQKEIKWLIN